MGSLAIVGGGSWGTALAIVLAPRFDTIRLWVYESDLAGQMQSERVNGVYLPGFNLPLNVTATADLGFALQDAAVVLGVMPSHHARALYEKMRPLARADAIFVSATKGLETGTLLRMSEVVKQATGARRIAVLSGPTFAREVAAGVPTAVVVASEDDRSAREIQAAFSGPTFRLYTNPDPVGVEIAAALKNVMAIGAGVCDGLGLGHNAIAAMVTRGLAEITRLAVKMGGRRETLSGLAGLGDLVLTCTGDLSRNRQVGLALGRGESLDHILGNMRMVAEGVRTTDAAVELGRQHGVDLPIIVQMYAMLRQGRPPREAIRLLMDRSLKGET